MNHWTWRISKRGQIAKRGRAVCASTQGSQRRPHSLTAAVCGIENWHDKDQFNHTPINTFPIWREFVYDGAHSDPKYTRLKSGEGNDESQKEGVRVVVGGGRIGKTDQKAVIEFRCKKDSERLRRADDENDGEPKDDKDGSDHPEWKEGEKADDGAGGLIEFQSYGNDTLRLNWYTPHGCEGSTSSGRSSESSGGWGFFSWFFFIVFMLLISYLLFSAWINYTRNGARGWDLLPHSDTIRDVPYIVGDWGRKIVGTMSGGGSRGGYSAV